MDDHQTEMRRIAWWIADIAVWISISFSVMAHLCQRFAEHTRPVRNAYGFLDMQSGRKEFAMLVGQGFGYVGVGWIVVSIVLAIMCRIRYGIAKETVTYLVLLVVALGVVGSLRAT
ncbi:hypothetical protein [Mycolicibacterium fortuitum]|jgi:hypothetical protein|uniref:Uncharacterized protein n=2 Tax=Mycolicibacterium fortuitum TaxID=1766 RepID=A0AAE4VF44_MYCFO|nr:hypothetical protein [Mycolicibacterium fortuitum]MCV7139543.1 hypothetical protein [Mycolicibacterium fortuitum]MDV7193815.1 hypothetical protein [Mycolicibacterium fortuitum]MDV7207224.1 hypothetical protein [Mycolicibacterium fortuitum]MDV7228829.1 hypothetical protein [Mycolicibacterium fortuitum]MDV7260674.1 hypothetical protein [Mycolicibacterium fortuitum]